MRLNKTLIVFIYFFLTCLIFLIEIKKTNAINYITNNINITTQPYHFLTKSLYFFDLAFFTKDINKSKFYLKLSESFLDTYKAKETKEAKKIIEFILKTHNYDQKLHVKFANLINKVSLSIYKSNLENAKKLGILKAKINQNSVFIEFLILFLIILITGVIFLYKNYINIKENFYKDYLTGALNRKKFYEVINALPQSYHTVVMMDIDHFKTINDIYGHDKGDMVLKEVVKIIREHIRKEDLIFRWGGEEFLILFKNVDSKKAFEIIKKIKHIIENHDFENIKVTASFGIKECSDKITEKDLIEVDKALYKAKEKRNEIVII